MKKILLSISMLALAYTASANVPVIKSDPKIEAQVEQTLKKLTLEEKIGQMMELVTDLFGANDKNGVFYIDEHKTDSILSRYKIGSILNAPNTCAPTAKQWEKYIAQIQSRLEGKGEVRCKNHSHNHRHTRQHRRRKPECKRFDRLVDNPRHQDRQKSPCQRRLQTDLTLEVEFFMGIIPVTDFEEGLHGGTGDILQRRGGQHAQEVHQPEMVRHRQGHKQDDNGAGAVNGQQGAVEEPPVHPLALLGGHVAGFPHPAAEAVKEKQQGPLARGIDVHQTILSSAGQFPVYTF